MKEWILIGVLSAIFINVVQNERDIAEWQEQMYPPKYNCTEKGVQAMIVDGVEDETINRMCFKD